jgi:hypothetical protein
LQPPLSATLPGKNRKWWSIQTLTKNNYVV